MGLFGGAKKQGASPLRRRRAASVRRGHTERREQSSQREQKAQREELAQRTAETSKRKSAPRKAPTRKLKMPSIAINWRGWGSKSLPVLAVTLVLGLLVGAWKLLDYVGSVPVSRVLVTGNLQHVDRNLLAARVQPLLAGAGFMTVDIQKIRGVVMELPWVAEAAIQRRWPDQLVIAVIEQEAIARWGSDGLLNRRGEVFRPQPLGDVSELPLLFGPDSLAAEVVARYAELRELLAAQQLTLANLGTDERGSWSAELQNGLVLHMGTGDVLKKIRRFSRVYRDDLSEQIGRIAYIDLRYSNGVAVGWKAAPATISPKPVAGQSPARQPPAEMGIDNARNPALAARERGQQTEIKQL